MEPALFPYPPSISVIAYQATSSERKLRPQPRKIFKDIEGGATVAGVLSLNIRQRLLDRINIHNLYVINNPVAGCYDSSPF